jgi:ribosomal protein S18 acetylase RimI-like enzyme
MIRLGSNSRQGGCTLVAGMLERMLEELALNAWPAPSNVLYDGWILRFGGGFTRRANSVNPLYGSSLPLDEKIGVCEAAYTGRQQATVFKLTAASQPPDLDAALAGAGYRTEATTSVQVADLSSASPALVPDVCLTEDLTEAWLDDQAVLVGGPQALRDIERRMLESIAPPRAFASLRQAGRPLALGMAVAERGYVGLFSIVTAVEARNQGLGRRLVGHLLAWGQQRGARAAQLAVMPENAPALRLYARFGFREAYRYWYRVKHAP